MKSERYPVDKVGRSVGTRGMHVKSVNNEQVAGDNSSPGLMHKCQGDSSHYNGEVEYIGLNAGDIAVNKHGRASKLKMDTTSGYVGDYLQLKDKSRFTAHENEDYIDNHAAELTVDTTSGYVSDYLALKEASRFTAHENKDYMDTHLGPYSIGGYSEIPSNKIRVLGDGRLPISDRLMGEDLRKTDQRMVFSDDIPGLHDSNLNPSVFYSKPVERNSLVQSHLRPTSAMIHPAQARVVDNCCATQGDASSILYNPDAPGLNLRQLSSVGLGINNDSESITVSTSPSTNRRWNSFREPCLMHMEPEDMNRWHELNIGGGFLNSALYGSNTDCMPSNEVRQLAPESVLYEACNSLPSLKSSSAPIPSSDISNSGRVHEPFSSLFHNSKSCLDNSFHPTEFLKNPCHEITLQKNNETFCPDVPWANDGHAQVPYNDSLDYGYDSGCYGDSHNNNCGHPKKKGSVFSRLSFMQDVYKQETRNSAWNEEYDFQASVDEVMEFVRQSHNQWMTKRKPKPSQHNKAEGLRDKTQTISSRMKGEAESLRDKTQTTSSRMKGEAERKPKPSQRNKAESLRDKTQTTSSRRKGDDCFENTLKDPSMDLTIASGGNSNKTAEGKCFVDFKRRSKVRKHSDEIENSFSESKKSENLVLVQQKRRKLIRPNFNNSTTSDDKGIDLGASQNLQVPLPHVSYNLKDVSEGCCTLVQTKDNVKTDAEVQNIMGPTHSEDNNSHGRGYVCSKGGEKANDGALPAFNDGSECVENINHQNVLSSASCKEESCHPEEGSCMMDNMKSQSLETESLHSICHSICQEHNADKIKCADRGINADEEMSKDRGSSFSIEVNHGSEYLQKSGNEKAPVETSCHIKEGLCMTDSIKSVSPGTESLHSISRGINTEDGMPKAGNNSFTTEVEDGSDSLQHSSNDNAPVATCEQKMA